ncbi:MAG TPA: hypothetical protein VE999_10380 [Gemmataceae bacterium]|nr:hypothetical protein [Gemmataceae bacterium]
MTTDVVVKSLAVVGGGVGGGLGLGLLAQLLMRATMVRKPPRWSVLVVRLFGAIICGWLVALWLFGGGGPGIGGAGGWGFGTGSGQGNRKQETELGKKNKDGKESEITKQVSPRESLRIEVLGKDALPEPDIVAERWYRIETGDGERLVAFDDVKEEIEKRQHENPPLRRIEIVLYKDSPDERVPIVSRLRSWAGDVNGGKMKVDISRRDTNASRK